MVGTEDSPILLVAIRFHMEACSLSNQLPSKSLSVWLPINASCRVSLNLDTYQIFVYGNWKADKIHPLVVKLLLSDPSFSASMCIILHLWFWNIPPKLADPGLLLEASSKFSFTYCGVHFALVWFFSSFFYVRCQTSTPFFHFSLLAWWMHLFQSRL